MDCTVVIPHKDRNHLLKRTVASLMKQDTKYSYEIVVVDDGSAHSPAALDPHVDHGNLRIISQTNRGSAAARNTGWQAASGEVVIFLDCDQLVRSSFIENHCRSFVYADAPVLQIGFRRWLAENHAIGTSSLDLSDSRDDGRKAFLSMTSSNLANVCISWHLCFSHNISVKKSLLSDLDGFDPNFTLWGLEDCEMAYRFKKSGVKLLLNPYVTAYHQHHSENFDVLRFNGWLANLGYFVSKHADPEVMAQYLLVPSMAQYLLALKLDLDDPADDSWTSAMMKMEKFARSHLGRSWYRKKRARLRRPSVDSVLTSIAKLEPGVDLEVEVGKEDVEMMVRIQTDTRFCDVHLIFED